jgi:mannose-6-phosphate isomerase-like protein (cupin superfamily)
VIVHGGPWEVGNTITFRFPPEVIDLTLSGEALEVDEPHTLAFTWGRTRSDSSSRPPAAAPASSLSTSYPATAAARNAAGWEQCLDRLAGLDPAPDTWHPHFEAYAGVFTPTLGHQDGPPAGYKGGQPQRPARHAKKNLLNVEDVAANHGLSETQEARFPRQDVGAEQTGMNYLIFKAGRREAFAHRHRTAEEIYVVLTGSGRVKIDEDLVELSPLDVVRVSPRVTRSFEAGPDGLEVLVAQPRL